MEKFARTAPRPILKRRWWKDSDEALVTYILDSEYYQSCTTYREQCHCLHYFSRQLFLSKNYMARLLNVDHKSYEKQLKLPLETKPIGRPKILTEEDAQFLHNILIFFLPLKNLLYFDVLLLYIFLYS